MGPFYPPGTKPEAYLRFYSEQFDTVEIDATYYAIPSAKTVESWAQKTPEHFLFAAKFPAAIVYAGKESRPDPQKLLTPEHSYALRDRFLEVMSRLGRRLGPLLLQFPFFNREIFPTAEPFVERLESFLTDLPPEFRYGVEIRNRAWLNSDFAGLCRKHHTALVLVDQAWMPLADELESKFDPVTTDFSYIRLLGDRKQIEALTTHWDQEVLDRGDHLKRWAGFLQRLARRRLSTFLYVNNHYAGHAPATLRKLLGLLQNEPSLL